MSQPTLSQNQFALTPFLGTVDMRYNYNTKAVEIDSTQVGTLYAGQPVKMVDSIDGVPKVIGCTANADEVLGFINYDVKSQVYAAGDRCEISQGGNVIYLLTTGAVGRGKQVTSDVSVAGAVKQLVAASGDDVVGWALDKATGAGQLIRVNLSVPSFLKA